MGRSSNALDPLTRAYDLGDEFAGWFLPTVHLIEGRDDIAIAQFEAGMERAGFSDTAWVRELVSAARDPVTGQAYLELRYPQILKSIPDKQVLTWEALIIDFYLIFGFIDRFYELILAVGPDGELLTDTDIRVWEATLFRTSDFTSHPRYLEVAELLGIVDIWKKRGPPDFCDKVAGQWVCE